MRASGALNIVLAFALLVGLAAAMTAKCAPSQAVVSTTVGYNSAAYSAANNLCSSSGAVWPGSNPTTQTQQAIAASCINDPTAGLCVDDCVARYQTACMTSLLGDTTPRCILVPGSGSLFNCVSKNKICGALNSSVCGGTSYPMCTWESSSSTCVFTTPANPTPPPGESVSDKCAPLHPIVIAMLVLMFLSFVIGVVVVAVVVVRNQKKADEEEQRREQAAAAAAEAKRARLARSKPNNTRADAL